jgi:hypothetical protein
MKSFFAGLGWLGIEEVGFGPTGTAWKRTNKNQFSKRGRKKKQIKKLLTTFSKSCQKVVKKLSKSCNNLLKLVKKLPKVFKSW